MDPREQPAGAPPGCFGLILKWIIAAVVIYLAAMLLPGVHIEGFVRAMVVAIVLGLLNMLVRPFLVFLTLPITLITLGLFLIVINALLISLTAWLLDGFSVDNFGWALLAAVVIGLLNLIFDAFVEGFTRSS